MCWTVEVAFDLRKRGQITFCRTEVSNIAYDSGCETLYTLHEYEGSDRLIQRNHLVTVIEFDSFEGASHFLKQISSLKYVYVECVYSTKSGYCILYASKRYLRMLSTEEMRNYKKYCKDLPENKTILNLISKTGR